jgi:hypothetical protein
MSLCPYHVSIGCMQALQECVCMCVCLCVCVCVCVLCLSLLVEVTVSTCILQDGPYASKEYARTNNINSHKSNVKLLFCPIVHSSQISEIAPFSLIVSRPHSLVVLILLALR